MANVIIGRTQPRRRKRASRERVTRIGASAAARADRVGPLAGRTAALLAACGVGAAAEHFIFDRRHAALRRHMARDRAGALVRHRSRDAVKRAKYLAGVAQGIAHKATHVAPGGARRHEPVDDVTLAHTVESAAFREAGVPKHHVNVNAENGIVYLRGHLERDDQVDRLVGATRAIAGVKDVRSLLHTASRRA